MNIDRHPCFNDKARHTFGRVHLPVAPRCNIQCKFCNRKFDCVNESRPGVTTGVLTPEQAMIYLGAVFTEKPNIAVMGIAGPGDPFANPEETMQTLRWVRAAYPEMLLCVATNGLGIGPYIAELAELQVSHVTVTVNAVDPAISEKIYAWVRHNKRVLKPADGARVLLEKQLDAIRSLKERGVTVKVNSIVIPGINDHHVPEVAKQMGEMGVDILNAVAYYPNEGAAFSDIPEPPKAMIASVRKAAAEHIPQMHHCTRCRADAVGMLGEKMNEKLMTALKRCETTEPQPKNLIPITAAAPATAGRPNVAVASMEGVLVNQHLGEACQLFIYGKENGGISLLETRETPEPGGGNGRWETLADTIGDCGTLLVSGIGPKPRSVLEKKGIQVMEIEGLIDDAVQSIYSGGSLRHMSKRTMTACGAQCTGGGMGCG